MKPRTCHICGTKSEKYVITGDGRKATCLDCLEERNQRQSEFRQRDLKVTELYLQGYPTWVIHQRTGISRSCLVEAVIRTIGRSEFNKVRKRRPKSEHEYEFECD